MRILHVMPTLGYGGVEKVVCNYFSVLDHDQVMFDFVTHGDIMPYHQELINKGCKIYYLSTIGRIGLKQYRKQVKDTIAVSSYDVVQIHVGHLMGLYAIIYRDLGAKKIICHAHTTKCVNSKHAILMPVFRFLSNHYSDYRIACGVDAGKFCFGGSSYTVLPNALSFNQMEKITGDDIVKVKKELGLKNCPLIVGHVGHFSSQKNHVFITNIIHDFLKINPQAKFVLIGDGPLKNDIQTKVKDNGDAGAVIFTGVRSDVYTCMKTFDVFILPSLYEGLPVVGIEAQAAGTPCLFSDNIDKTVDIGAGIVELLPITQGTECWTKALSRVGESHVKKDKALVYESLCKSKHELSVTSDQLMKIYISLRT